MGGAIKKVPQMAAEAEPIVGSVDMVGGPFRPALLNQLAVGQAGLVYLAVRLQAVRH